MENRKKQYVKESKSKTMYFIFFFNPQFFIYFIQEKKEEENIVLKSHGSNVFAFTINDVFLTSLILSQLQIGFCFAQGGYSVHHIRPVSFALLDGAEYIGKLYVNIYIE